MKISNFLLLSRVRAWKILSRRGGKMLNRVEPEVGQWYRSETGAVFEVVALDEEEGIVEIQYFDGAIEELDTETWYAQMLQPEAEPEDWSGPFDDLVADDFGDTEQVKHPEDLVNPIETLDWETKED
jgi:hypothetical protein